MKPKFFTFIAAVITAFALSSTLSAQSAGDFVATTSGDYNTAANWSVSNGSGGFTGTASSAPTTAINVWIPENIVMTTAAQSNALNMNIAGELNCGNFTVQLGTNAGTTAGNLTITSTGKLRSSNATGGTVNSLNIYGSTITVDGQLGAATATNTTAYNAASNPNGGGGFRVYCMAVKANETTTVNISGSGKINIARFYGSSQTTASAPQVININTDINILNNNSTSVAAFGSIGNTGGSSRTINISPGKTVKFTGDTPKSSMHRDAVTVGNYTSGDFIYNVAGTLDMGKGTIRLYTSYTSGNSKGTFLNVKDGGTLVVGDTIRLQPGQASGQICGIFPETGSTVKFGQSTSATQFKNNIGAATAEFPAVFSNLILDNTAGLIYPVSFTVNDHLTLVNGKILLDNNHLTIGNSGTISGFSGSNYIVTTGEGTLIQNATAGTKKEFPVGAAATSYDPVSLTPATESVFAVRVGTNLPAIAPSGYSYNPKAWNITPVTASSTLVELTPSEVTSVAANHVIGHYMNETYTNLAAVKNGNTYSAVFSTFSPFVTGATDLGTGIETTKNKPAITSIGNQLIISGINAGEIITIINAAGQQISRIAATSAKTTINLNNGLYFVKVNHQVQKVIL